jgi:hypothetical protein
MIFKIISRHDQVKLALARQIRGSVEQRCKFGRIDILTEHEAIEVKRTSLWKQAIGQALVYSEATDTMPRIHLYGKDRLPKHHEDVVTRLGVRLSYDLKQ